MTDRATGRESDKFMLRLPDGMRARLKEEAAENGRSLNAEIVHRLEQSLAENAVFPLPPVNAGPQEFVKWLKETGEHLLSVSENVQAMIKKPKGEK